MEKDLGILIESLGRKKNILQTIAEYSKEQEKVLQMVPMELEQFDLLVEKKDALVSELLRLDEGFSILYERIAQGLKLQRQKYSSEIQQMQKLIATLTELSVSIQAQEQRNKKMLEAYFTKERSQIRKGRVNAKVAYDYYKQMNGTRGNSSTLYDNKQ